MEFLQLPQHIVGSDLAAFVDGMQEIGLEPEQMHAGNLRRKQSLPAEEMNDRHILRTHCS
jgi:hypothetical protein